MQIRSKLLLSASLLMCGAMSHAQTVTNPGGTTVIGGSGGGNANGTPAVPATSSTPGTVQLAPGQSSTILSPVATSGSYSDLTNKPTPIAWTAGSYPAGATVIYTPAGGYPTVYVSSSSGNTTTPGASGSWLAYMDGPGAAAQAAANSANLSLSNVNPAVVLSNLGIPCSAQQIGAWGAGPSYACGSIVQNASNVSFIALQNVPANTALTNGTYWLSLMPTGVTIGATGCTGTNPFMTGLSTSAVGACGVLASTPPYLQLLNNYYIGSDNFYQAQQPLPLNLLPGWQVFTGSKNYTLTTNPNGDAIMTSTGGPGYLAAAATTHTSLEASMAFTGNTSNGEGQGGLFLYDSTNHVVQMIYFQGGGSGGLLYQESYTCTCTIGSAGGVGTGSVNGGTTNTNSGFQSPGQMHLKETVSGTTATFSYSFNGGVSFTTLGTFTVGTVTYVGFFVGAAGQLDIYSALAQ